MYKCFLLCTYVDGSMHVCECVCECLCVLVCGICECTCESVCMCVCRSQVDFMGFPLSFPIALNSSYFRQGLKNLQFTVTSQSQSFRIPSVSASEELRLQVYKTVSPGI